MARPRKTPNAEAVDIPGLPDDLVTSFDPALPKTAQVYEIMRRAVVGMALEPGSIVNEKLICDQLGISRTPLREAILQLSSENLVSVVPNAGTCVLKIDRQSVFDGQLVRDALEMKVVRLAAAAKKGHLDRTFTMIRRYIVERRDYFSANAGDVLDSYVGGG